MKKQKQQLSLRQHRFYFNRETRRMFYADCHEGMNESVVCAGKPAVIVTDTIPHPENGYFEKMFEASFNG